jgi:hypothetical protein
VAAPSPAWSQPVTLADIRGAVIDVSSVAQEKIRRSDRILSLQIRTTGQLTVGSGDTVAQSFQSSAIFPDGRTRGGQQRSGTFTLGRPKKTTTGDDAIWLFSNASLVRLSVHGKGGAGGQKMTIAFTRGPDGLRCRFSMPMARESGVGDIRKDSAVDTTPIQILEFKQVSSSCRVTKH